MVYPNHNYINDGIMYTNHLFDEHGNHIRASDLWQRWVARGPNTHAHTHKVMSYDNGYVVNQIIDMRVCGLTELVAVTTKSNRKIMTSLDSTLLTKYGMLGVRNLGIGTPLLTVDYYKGYQGDTLKLDTSGNGRVRALLRSAGMPFTINENGGTVWDNTNIYCVDWDTDGPVEVENNLTFGLNNYRESLKQIYGLPDFVYDPVVRIAPARSRHVVAIYVDGPQNVVIQNGMIVQTTQTEVRNDR